MKITLQEVKPGYAASTIRTNFEKIEQFLDDLVIKRQTNYPTEPNEMRTYLCITQGVVNEGSDTDWTGGISVPPIDPPVAGCTIAADIMLVHDNTGSQKQDEYYTLVLPAISNMIDALIGLERDMTLGATVIVETPYLAQALSSDLTLTQTAINGMPEPAGRTNLAEAIRLASAELTTNGREGIPGFIVIITDGVPNFTTIPDTTTAVYNATVEADAARAAGWHITVFGVMGQDLTEQEGGGGG